MKAKQRARPVTTADEMRIESALMHLHDARDLLRKAEAGNAANYVARAMKSVQGALNHARAYPLRAGRKAWKEGAA